jgi:serine O-acetyltransferase
MSAQLFCALLLTSHSCLVQMKTSNKKFFAPKEPNWLPVEISSSERNPGSKFLKTLKAFHCLNGSPLRWLWQIRGRINRGHKFWRAVSGADVPINCQIGHGLIYPHPNGIVVFSPDGKNPSYLLVRQVPVVVERVGTRDDARIFGSVDFGNLALIDDNRGSFSNPNCDLIHRLRSD